MQELDTRSRVRTWLTVGAVVVVGLIVLVLARPDDSPEEPAGPPLLPDLWSTPPFELRTEMRNGERILRFTSEINNQGDGDLIIRGNPRLDLSQWVQHDGGGHTPQPLAVDVVWGGDTHDHWHIDNVARYWLESVTDPQAAMPEDSKVGFCIFDSVDRLSGLPRAPTAVHYEITGCGSRLVTELAMGLSVGWGDQYSYTLAGQWIVIDRLDAGVYRLYAEVDPDHLFSESNPTNNVAFTEFTLVDEDGPIPTD